MIVILHSEIIYSPGVGQFLLASRKTLATGQCCIGYLRRLNEIIPITIPENHRDFEYLVKTGQIVSFGTPLVRLLDNPIVQNSDSNALNTIAIVAPADGFLTCTNDFGMPIRETDMPIRNGDVIAILEFMKIRMDITYDGTDAIFLRYVNVDHRGVKKGETIAEVLVSSIS